jgi:hypothetical protein
MRNRISGPETTPGQQVIEYRRRTIEYLKPDNPILVPAQVFDEVFNPFYIEPDGWPLSHIGGLQ